MPPKSFYTRKLYPKHYIIKLFQQLKKENNKKKSFLKLHKIFNKLNNKLRQYIINSFFFQMPVISSTDFIKSIVSRHRTIRIQTKKDFHFYMALNDCK